jgi:hypothetical protein
MKKLFTLFFLTLVAFVVKAQSLHTIDFEPDGVGAEWGWSVAENDDNPAVEFVSNPLSDDVNSSVTVAKFTARETGNNWALCYTDDDGEFTFDESNSTITIKVYKTVISNIGFKVEGGTGTATQLLVANTITDGWEEITFDFSSLEGQKFSQFVIIPDFISDYVDGTDRTEETIIYFDDIQIADGEVVDLAEPTVAADTPSQDETNVISIYSDAYTDVADTDFNPNWGQSTAVSYETIGDDNVLLYSSLGYQGTQFTNQDVSDYDYLHIDFWTANSEDLNIYLIGADGETSYALTISLEEWVGTDIPLSTYDAVDLSDVYQFKITGNGTIWIDNLYFWKDVSTSVGETKESEVEVYPNPASDILNIEGADDGEIVQIYSVTGTLVKRVALSGGIVSVTDLSQGVYFVSVNGTTMKIIKK